VHIYNTYKNTGTKEELLFSFFWHYKKQGIRAKKRVNYYPHGPLARVEYGNYNSKVQGIDYAYTLQGWIKGVNSNSLDNTRDMGQDGLSGGHYDEDNTDIHKAIAKDAFGFTLNYFKNDYNAISSLRWNDKADRFESSTVGSQMEAARYDLFNGNISSMVSTITEIDTVTAATVTSTTAIGLANAQTPKPLATAYNYDQLNRLKSSVAFNNIDLPNNVWKTNLQAVTNMYANAFTYDANGNILSQNRSNEAGVEFDALQYQYKKNAGKTTQNRLYHVNDGNSNTALQTDDIEDDGAFDNAIATINTDNNYRYDEIGNLKHDSKEDIENIEWTLYGKVKSITRPTNSTKDNLVFDYDANGNRTAKHVYSADNNWKYSTYYIHDVSGIEMSIYNQKNYVSAGNTLMGFTLTEQGIYGRARIGLNLPNLEMTDATIPRVIAHVLGKKEFELTSNRNVTSVLSDRRIPIDDGTYLNGLKQNSTHDGIVDYYQADVINSSDFSAFGAKLYNRGFAFSDYRYGGAGGQEKDDEIYGAGNSYSAEYWQYDPRLGKRWNVDPITYPWQSAYAAFNNNPIYYSDPSGLEGEGGDDTKKGGEGTRNPPSEPDPNDDMRTYKRGPKKEEPTTVADNTSVSIKKPPMVNRANTEGETTYAVDLKKILDISAKIEGSAETITLALKQSYVLERDGTFHPNMNEKLNKINYGTGVTDDLAGANEFLSRTGIAISVVIVVKDAADVFSDHINNTNMDKSVGTLIVDATGAVLGYLNPATGVFFALSLSIMDTPEYDDALSSHAVKRMEQITEGYTHDGKVDYYGLMADKNYIANKDMYYKHCHCYRGVIPNTKVVPPSK
jgi:hypothetical protein